MSSQQTTAPPSRTLPACLGMILGLAAAALAWKYFDDVPRQEILPDEGMSAAISSLTGMKQPQFVVPMEDRLPDMGPPPEKVARYLKQKARVDVFNIVCGFLVLGAVLAPAVTFASCCGAWRFVVSILALPLGAALGTGVGYGAAQVYGHFIPETVQPEVGTMVIVDAISLGILGAAVGILVGLFTGSVRNVIAGLFAGAVSGALGGLAFPTICALTMPEDAIETLIPVTSKLRLIWLALGFGFIGLFVPGSLKARAGNSSERS